MLGSHSFSIIEVRCLATKLQDGCVCTVGCPAVLLKLSWFSASDYIKNMEYTDDRKFIEVYVCQKVS